MGLITVNSLTRWTLKSLLLLTSLSQVHVIPALADTATSNAITSGTVNNSAANCALALPPDDAGETQAHGVILYIYPRNPVINTHYTGCQSQWFYDDDHFRKLEILHFRNGVPVAYEKLRIDGEVAFRCEYKDGAGLAGNNGRCPEYETLTRPSYHAGCHSQSYLNTYDSYNLAFASCRLE